ncbi:MAG: DinB family protein [Vicinamibacterales bacterium]
MPIVDALLPEYDHEMATTRKVLERVPDDKFAWKPHDKSMSMQGLATHVATLTSWGKATIEHPTFDLAVPHTPPQVNSRADLLRVFDETSAATRASLVGRSDAELLEPWSLKHGEQTILTMPKVGVLRSFVLNHLIHHRGQLSVYLRLQDVPVPSIYGPSADEGGM